MNTRLCAFTGVLMACAVAFTFVHMSWVQDPAGTTSRWWDGSVQSRDTFYNNGAKRTHTEFGDDGKTVLVYREWERNGILVREKLRQDDGKLEDKAFDDYTGRMIAYTLWTPDEQEYTEKREWYDNGKLRSEEKKTEDGKQRLDIVLYEYNGAINQEAHLLPNGDSVRRVFDLGKLVREEFVYSASGVQEINLYYDTGVKKTYARFTTDGSVLIETFSEAGDLELRREQANDQADILVTVFHKDKSIRFTQRINARGDLVEIVEYSPVSNKPKRRTLNPYNLPATVELFREDGTLSQVKKVGAGGKVLSQTTYDATGRSAVGTSSTGTNEQFDEILLKDATYTIGKLQRER